MEATSLTPQEMYHHLSRIDGKLDDLSAAFTKMLGLEKQIKSMEARIMKTLADLQADVAKNDEVIDSAVTLIRGLAEQVKNLAPNQAAIDALAADLEAKTASLADAVAANTPAA